jgi:hypothetical protein
MVTSIIDLDSLSAAAARTDTPNAEVSRNWLRAVEREIRGLRAQVLYGQAMAGVTQQIGARS